MIRNFPNIKIPTPEAAEYVFGGASDNEAIRVALGV